MGEQLNSKKISHEEFDIITDALLKNAKMPMKTHEIHEILREKGWLYSLEVTRKQLERNKNIIRTVHPTKNTITWIHIDKISSTPTKKEIDEIIIQLVNNLDREPVIDEVAKELGEDPQDHDMRRIIAKRLKVISASIKSVETIIQELYDFGKKSDDIKRIKGNEIVILAIHEPSERGMPSDVEIIREACKKNKDLDVTLITKIIPLCKKNFKRKIFSANKKNKTIASAMPLSCQQHQTMLFQPHETMSCHYHYLPYHFSLRYSQVPLPMPLSMPLRMPLPVP